MIAPEWWLWQADEGTRIWEAVALSLNINPVAMSHKQKLRANGYTGVAIGQIVDAITDTEFDNRRSLLEKSYAKESEFGHFGEDGVGADRKLTH